jgi:hypothetical protein
MFVQHVTPILNVSDFQQSVEWFEKWGWKKLWDWGEPTGFGAVASGHAEIFLCVNGQGGRGKADAPARNGFNESNNKGVWMSAWVDDVDAVHRQCVQNGIEVLLEPTDMEWNVREMHIQHPDGHIFRVGKGFEEEEETG